MEASFCSQLGVRVGDATGFDGVAQAESPKISKPVKRSESMVGFSRLNIIIASFLLLNYLFKRFLQELASFLAIFIHGIRAIISFST